MTTNRKQVAAPPPHWQDHEALEPLQQLAIEVRELQRQIADLETQKKAKLGEIEFLLMAEDLPSARGDDWVAVRVSGGKSEKLDKKKLVEQGVTLVQIKAATVVTERKGYTQVRGIKEMEVFPYEPGDENA